MIGEAIRKVSLQKRSYDQGEKMLQAGISKTSAKSQ